jgi:DNA-binding transcriptional LysR family regulator
MMTTMHIATLKVYCDVARCRSFSLAAQANDITQSAVSQIVSQLEKRLRTQLVDRSHRPLQLTNLGQIYYEGCKSILEQYAELESTIRSAQEEIAGTVEVAAIYSVGLGDMGQYAKLFGAQWPQAQVHFDYLHPDRVYEKVLEGTADLGLVSFPRKSPKLEVLPWREETMVLACPPRHPLAQRSSAHISDLEGEKYVHFDRNLVIRREVDRFFKEQRVGVDVVMEFDNIEQIKNAVALGNGVALLPEPTLRHAVKARDLVAMPLVDCSFTRPLGIIHRRRPRFSAAARRFLDLLLEESAASRHRNGATGIVAAGTLRNGTHKNGHCGRQGIGTTSKNQ